MAIEKDIPKDISKYESKLIGPFTTRQVVCLIPGIGLGVGGYFLLGAIEAITIAQDVKLFIAIFLALPFLLCGFIKLYNIPFEKFAKIVFVSNFLAPKHRLYKTKNNFEFINTPEVPVDKKKQAKELKIKEKYVSKNPELIPFK